MDHFRLHFNPVIISIPSRRNAVIPGAGGQGLAPFSGGPTAEVAPLGEKAGEFWGGKQIVIGTCTPVGCTHMIICLYIYIYVCMYIYVCVCDLFFCLSFFDLFINFTG